FVAGDLFFYPVEGDPATRTAPDALVSFGRPKGHRGSYKQWEEGGIAPQVVFEVLSPGNRFGELQRKLDSYDRFAVQQYYQYDPDRNVLLGWIRDKSQLRPVARTAGWVSPRLGVRFELTADDLKIIRPDGHPLETYAELARRAERLAAKLRAAGLDPDA